MNLKSLATLSGIFFVLLLFIAGCQQEEGIAPNGQISYRGAGVNCGTGLTTTYPTSVVCSGDNFTVSTVGTCGRWKIQETTTNAACDATIGWTDLNGAFTCAGTYSYTTPAPRAPGVYHFRTVHLQNVTGPCSISTCPGFTGEQYCCFDVTVGGCGCDDSFTAECSDDGCGENTITFTYVAGEDGSVVIQGGLNANAVICSVASSEGTVIPFGNPHDASVRRLEVDVEECDEVTVTISWDGPGNTGSWSAKRDGTAVGGDLEDGYLSEQDCSDPE